MLPLAAWHMFRCDRGVEMETWTEIGDVFHEAARHTRKCGSCDVAVAARRKWRRGGVVAARKKGVMML